MTTTPTTTNLETLLQEHRRVYERWVATHDEADRAVLVDCWRIAPTHPQRSTGSGCQPSVISRYTGADLQYRGVCLTCEYVADTIRDHENQAVEDAHDHTHPRWRELPVLQPGPRGDAPRQIDRWASIQRDHMAETVPADWSERQGPSWTTRPPTQTRHVPGRGVYGGYDLGTTSPQTVNDEQMTLL